MMLGTLGMTDSHKFSNGCAIWDGFRGICYWGVTFPFGLLHKYLIYAVTKSNIYNNIRHFKDHFYIRRNTKPTPSFPAYFKQIN